MKEHSFRAGQTVVVDAGGPNLSVDTVKGVWKNGVISLADAKSTFKPPEIDGRCWRRSPTYGRHGVFLRALKDGETAESIAAGNAARLKKGKRERAAKDRSHAKAVSDWWASGGESLWASRQEVHDTFAGEKACILRFNPRPGDYTMALLIVRKEFSIWADRDEFVIKVAGMRATAKVRTEDVPIIGAFVTSDVRAFTLEEALYLLTH